MSPLDLDQPDALDVVPFSVKLASRRALIEREHGTPKAVERRAYARRRARDLEWLETVRLTGGTGYGTRLIDLSEGGALLEVNAPLRPGIRLTLELSGPNLVTSVPLEVLRCYVADLGAATIYRGACAFERLIQLPSGAAPAAPPNPALPTFVGNEAALLFLHARSDGMDRRQILTVLDALHARAAARNREPGREKEYTADLLAAILPPLHLSAQREEVVGLLYQHLRLLPEHLQVRMQETSARLLGLIERCTPEAADHLDGLPGPKPPAAPAEGASSFQKIVVRYADGKLAKGFTQDFHPRRPQFSLWPSINSRPAEREVVPVARLKAVFFVKNFDGNPGYRERKSFAVRGQGRRIEVTFLDTEVILGTTLNYRADAQGFFVIPADPAANNNRIFVVTAAVKRVRFP